MIWWQFICIHRCRLYVLILVQLRQILKIRLSIFNKSTICRSVYTMANINVITIVLYYSTIVYLVLFLIFYKHIGLNTCTCKVVLEYKILYGTGSSQLSKTSIKTIFCIKKNVCHLVSKFEQSTMQNKYNVFQNLLISWLFVDFRGS